MRKGKRLLSSAGIPLIALLLCACTPPFGAPPCDELTDLLARKALATAQPSIADLTAQLADLYAIEPGAISTFDADEGSTGPITLNWEANNRRYRLDVSRTNLETTVFWVGYDGYQPTISEVIECIGTPTGYTASLGPGSGESGTYLSLMLFFPMQGAIVMSDTWGLPKPDSKTILHDLTLNVADLKVSGFSFTEPKTTPLELLDTYLTIGLELKPGEEDAAQFEWHRRQVTTWPADGKSFQYTTEPFPLSLYGP
jgi:hypothetical protein